MFLSNHLFLSFMLGLLSWNWFKEFSSKWDFYYIWIIP